MMEKLKDEEAAKVLVHWSDNLATTSTSSPSGRQTYPYML